jgi:restriction system protein
VCERCGWWSYDNDDPDPYLVSHWSSRALLKTFAVGDFDVPVTELARYLQEHEDAMSMVHPAKFEELVGSVFSSYFGYRVDYCSYGRPDLGIDLVVLNTDENKPIALQVKRYRAPIELGQIHQFFGALVDSGYKQGVFVTSGRFRSGASAATGRLNANSEITIDLLDGKKFLEFIAVTNSQARSVYENVLSSITKATGRVQTARIVESMRERSRSTSAREER